MIIKSMRVSNFKGIKDELEIEFKPLNLLFGPNSAGKSTIIQALHYAREIIERSHPNPRSTALGGSAIDLGEFENFIHLHDTDQKIVFDFLLDIKGQYIDDFYDDQDASVLMDMNQTKYPNIMNWSLFSKYSPDISTANIKFEISYDNILQKVRVTKYSVYINNEMIGAMISPLGENKTFINFINFFHASLSMKNFYNDNNEDIGDFSDEETINAFSNITEEMTHLEKTKDAKMKIVEYCENIKKFNDFTNKLFKKYSKYTIDNEEDKIIIREKFREINEKSNESYNMLMEYEFWIYFKSFFEIEELNSDLHIECSPCNDSLPKWDGLLEFEGFYTKGDPKNIDLWFSAECSMKSVLRQIFVGFGQLLRTGLNQITYIGPIRNRIPRNYQSDSYIDPTKWFDGSAAWDTLANCDQEFLDQVNHWMLDRLKTGYVFQKKENSEIYIINIQNNAELRPIDVGVGISQILPVVVAALQTKNGFLAIEQPELHIHPALQVELGDLFLSCAQNSNACLLIETHSEHLLLRIMRRIRETFERSEQNNLEPSEKSMDVYPEEVGVSYVEIDRGKTIAREMPLNVRGELVMSWPGGFFEEDLEEVL